MTQQIQDEWIINRPTYLWFLILSYSMVIVLANWFDARLINLWGVVTDAGTLIFPLTFLLSDVITEVYGYKHARRAIWTGFLFNLLFILYGQLIIHLPNPPYATMNALFNQLLAVNTRIIFASIISYCCAEPLNAYFLAKLKISCRGRWMSLRFVVSTFVAAALDSVLFGVIAFYALLNTNHLIILICTMWLIKIAIEILLLPLSVHLANRLKKKEALDIYDMDTDFNFFRFNGSYSKENNKFHMKKRKMR